MTTLLEIKPYIHDFIQENLDEKFGDKIYWIGERVNEPDYPYCMLTELAENKDKRTSTQEGNIVIYNSDYFFINEPCLNVEKLFYFPSKDVKIFRREKIITRYKTAVITVGIYNAFVSNTYEDMDMDEAKEFAYQQIDNLEGEFEDYPINNKFSIQNISPIRPLHEPVNGGYMYRYEFDLTIGYNEPVIKRKDYGRGINVEGDINFTVAIDNNDNIDIETTI